MLDQQLQIDVRRLLLDSDRLPREFPVRYTSVGLGIQCGVKGQAIVCALYDETTSEVLPGKALVKFVPGVGQGEHLYTEVIMRADPYLIAGLVEGMAETVYFAD